MWKIIIMAENKDDSVVQTFDDRDEELAHLAFVGADVAGECVNMWRDGIRVRGDWTRTKSGRRVHRSCLENHNECMDTGYDRGSCRDDRCWLKGE